ncbi:MAG: DMT family transporter [Isosphaeraceae bacterium]
MAEADESGSPERRVDLVAYLYLGLMVLIGSSTAASAKFAVRELPAGFLPLVRFGGAGLLLLPLIARRGSGFGRMVRQDGWRLLVTAALCVPINQWFFLNAARLTTTSHVALIYASCPLVVLLLAWVLGQERLVPARLVGVLVSVFGVAVIGADSLWRGGGAGGRETLLGDLLLVGAVASWGGYLTTSKLLIARHGPLNSLAGTFLVGTFLHLPIALWTLPGWGSLLGASATAWWGLAHLTLVVTVLGLAFQSLAMRRLDASQVATVGNAAPVLTVVWGVWLLGESFTPALALGGALTLGGILWTNRPTSRAAVIVQEADAEERVLVPVATH